MRTLCALVMLVAASTSAMAGAYEKWNSNLMINQLAEICDPTEAGAAQLYCTYYVMGLVDGLVLYRTGLRAPLRARGHQQPNRAARGLRADRGLVRVAQAGRHGRRCGLERRFSLSVTSGAA